MNTIIKKYLAQKGIQAILRKRESLGVMNIILLDYLGKDDKYYSFLAGYNDLQIFSRTSRNILTKDNTSLDDLIESNLLCFDTKEEYLEGRWKDINVRQFTNAIESQLCDKDLSNTTSELRGVELVKIKPIMQPFCGYIVYYRLNGVNQNPLLYALGQGLITSDILEKRTLQILNGLLTELNLTEREL